VTLKVLRLLASPLGWAVFLIAETFLLLWALPRLELSWSVPAFWVLITAAYFFNYRLLQRVRRSVQSGENGSSPP
jgi:hypothetical protein